MHNTKLILTMFVTMAVCLASPASAQTLFTRPDTTPNYAKYHYIDECVSAIDRLTREADFKDSIWSDTAHYDLVRLKRPLPANAIVEGKACLARFNFDTITRSKAIEAADALLKADRDADALRLYLRLRDSASTRILRDGAIDELLWRYEVARPMRVAAAKELHERWFAEGGPDSLSFVMLAQLRIARMTRAVGDTEYARKAVRAAMAANDGRPVAERNADYQQSARTRELYPLLKWVTEDEEADSLSKSTASYRAYRAGLIERIFGDSLAGRGELTERRIPEIPGDFVYRFSSEQQPHSTHVRDGLASYRRLNNDQKTHLPVPGRINAVAFLRGGCHGLTTARGIARPNPPPHRVNSSVNCINQISILRRLKHKFPDLEITVVTHTFGSLGNAPPLEPPNEADTLAKFFLGFHRIPGTLVVSTTPYFRLAGFDNRRIDQPTAYEDKLEQEGVSTLGIMHLVDENGVVFFSFRYPPERELEMERILRAAVNRLRR